MNAMIICCGEALIDMLPRQLADGSADRNPEENNVFLPVSGGAVFNTAIALGRLGAETGFVSGISNDMFGEQLIDSLTASNVSTDYCIRSDQPSTLAFVKLVDGQAQYSFMDENSAGRVVELKNIPSLPEEIEAFHFGAISLIPEPCGSTYEALMERHHEHSVISLDPNIRPSFIDDPEKHRARMKRMIAMSDIVKVSDEDLDWLAPDEKHQSAIDQMLQQGPKIVILTKGSKGVELFTHNGTVSVPAKSVEVVDTIGAGDSFNAGFLFGLKKEKLLEKTALKNASPEALQPAAELAVQVAAITVSRAGANPPWAAEL